MAVSYEKLWILLIRRNMKKKDLKAAAGINDYMIYKLNHNEPITTDVVAKICRALGCSFEDICEFSDGKEQA